jgi:hypothetical protein
VNVRVARFAPRWPTFARRAVAGGMGTTLAQKQKSPPRQCRAGESGEEPDATSY